MNRTMPNHALQRLTVASRSCSNRRASWPPSLSFDGSGSMRMTTLLPTRVLTVACILVGCALLSGCGLGQARKDAEKVVARHFQTIATNGYAAAVADYGPQAFQKTTREQWIEMQPKIAAKLGTYVSHTMKLGKLQKKMGSSGSTTTVVLTCEVTYSKHSATETFTLVKGRTGRDFKIIGHSVNSAGFLE